MITQVVMAVITQVVTTVITHVIATVITQVVTTMITHILSAMISQIISAVIEIVATPMMCHNSGTMIVPRQCNSNGVSWGASHSSKILTAVAVPPMVPD